MKCGRAEPALVEKEMAESPIPDRVFQFPLPIAILLEEIAIVVAVDDLPEFSLGVAAELAEVADAEGVEIPVALAHNLDRLVEVLALRAA